MLRDSRKPWLASFLTLAMLAAAALAPVGCGTTVREYVNNGFKVGPNYKQPESAVAENWIDKNDKRVHLGDPNLVSWWDVFDDPILTDLIQRSYLGNLTVRAVGFQILAAREQRAIALGELLPQSQTASLQFLRAQSSLNGAATTAALGAGASLAPGAVLSSVGTGTGTTTTPFNPATGSGIGGGGAGGGGVNRFFSNWATNVNLSWELDFWGLFRRNLEAADASLDQSVDNYDEAVVMLLANVASFYVEIRTLQKRIDLAKKNIADIEPLVAVLEQRYKAGTATLPDWLQLKATLDNTKALIPQLEITLRQTNNMLCLALGLPTHDLLPEIGDGTVPDPADPNKRVVRIPKPKGDDVIVGIPGNLLLRRPDVLAAEEQLKIQLAQVGIAEAEMLPHIGINGSIGLAAKNFNQIFQSTSGTGSIGPSLSWSILNYGRLLANVRFQDLTYRQFVANFQNSILNANMEAENAMVGFLKSQDQNKFLQDSSDEARDTLRYLIKQRTTGFLPKGQDTTAFMNLLFNLNNFYVTQQDSAAQAEGNISLNLILMYRAMGGGWQIRNSSELVGQTNPPNLILTPPTIRAHFGHPCTQ
jgi:NodT family efflux transporter outer membrane factor (OMF) lipoprotein